MTGLVTEAPLSRRATMRVAVPFLVVTLIWGTTWLVIRDQLGTVPPSWSITYRFLVASIAMFAAAAIVRAPLRPQPGAVGLYLLLAVCQFFLNFNFVYRAEAHVTSGLVAVVFALLIVPNAILARIFLGLGVSRPFITGSAVALAGIALLFHHELSQTVGDAAGIATGIGLTLAGVVSASIANVVQATDLARRQPMTAMLGSSMLIGALMNAGYAWATAGAPVFDPRPGYVLGVLYLGLGASALAFALYFGTVRAIGPGRAAYSGVLVPILAMALSTLFEDYRWTVQSGVAAGLTLLGLLIALRAPRPAR